MSRDKEFELRLTTVLSEILALPHWVAFLEAIRNKPAVAIGQRAGEEHASLNAVAKVQLHTLTLNLSSWDVLDRAYVLDVSLNLIHNTEQVPAVLVRESNSPRWEVPEHLYEEVILLAIGLTDLLAVKNYKVSKERKEYVPFADRGKDEFVLPDVLDGAIASYLANIASHNLHDPDYKFTPDDRDIILAGYERLEKLIQRLAIYEYAMHGEGLTGKQLKEMLSVYLPTREDQERSHSRPGNAPAYTRPLLNLLPRYDLEAGVEPSPFIQGGEHGRFVNMEWIEWKKKSGGPEVRRENPEVEDRQLVEAAARRTVEILYPTEEARRGINWCVNASRQPRGGRTPADVMLPYEIRLTREFSERV